VLAALLHPVRRDPEVEHGGLAGDVGRQRPAQRRLDGIGRRDLRRRLRRGEGFYLSLPVIAGVPRAFDEMLAAGHEVFVCTSPLSGTRWCMPEKLA
jgi:hypothetical protein